MKVGEFLLMVNKEDGSDLTPELLDTLQDRIVDVIEKLDCQCFAMGRILANRVGEDNHDQAGG